MARDYEAWRKGATSAFRLMKVEPEAVTTLRPKIKGAQKSGIVRVRSDKAWRFYDRKGLYSLEDVLAKVGDLPVIWDGDLMPMDSHRYYTFKNSLTCWRCGRIGSYFAKERSAKTIGPNQRVGVDEPYHFNLYALDADGVEVLMTKDHIIPKSKGGANEVSNYRTMCSPCNAKRGNAEDEVWAPEKVVVEKSI